MSRSAPSPSGARAIALGIVTSRLFGLLRDRAVAWFFGLGAFADVYRTALRLPGVLQNLLGEQALSAAFIPTYVRLLEEGREEDAGRFAGAVLGLLVAATSALVLAGVLLAPTLVAVLATGYLGDARQVAAGAADVDRYALAVAAVRIVFPMSGLLVLSAWALGVLNSHRRFFLPYAAPVAWNVAIITALVVAAAEGGGLRLPGAASVGERQGWLLAALWGALVGGALQLAVQLPTVARLLSGFRLSLSRRVVGVRGALAAFGPALLGRGVVQLSSYLDSYLATFAHPGTVGAVGCAVALHLLPLSVFGMSVAAAELPELARAGSGAQGEVERRFAAGVRQSAFVICPATVGYLLLGPLVVAVLYRGGSFGREDQRLVSLVLAAYATGLLASTVSRLLQNTFFALGDTRTPARIAAVRMLVSALVGGTAMWWLDRFPVAGLVGVPGTDDLTLAAVGLGVGSGVGSWVELALLRRALRRRLPALRLPVAAVARRTLLAVAAALPALLLWWWLAGRNVFLVAAVVLPTYAAIYLGYARLRRLPELAMWLGRRRAP